MFCHVFHHKAHQDLIWCIEACNWTEILFVAKRFFVFGSRTVFPDGHHSAIITVSIYSRCFLVFSSLNFFLHILVSDGKIPTRFALWPSLPFTSSIHDIFGVGLFCSQTFPQNSTNLCILGISTSRFSTVQKKVFLVSLEHDVMFLSDCFFQCISPTLPSCNEAYQAIAT